ncbi:MAG: N-6 DNA methylase [Leptospiraceae bacterium]|nr:N-6 DNA methylase [Leptospiraceae bacterium]
MVKTPRQSLNKAFLKLKPNRPEIERFKENLIRLLSKIDKVESEENQKNHVRDFLRDTYYEGKYEINTKDRNDLVIHNGKDSKSSVGVILEAKRPNNKAEMLTKENINAKAMQELVLYFLRERITQNNKEVKYLIATNVYEWFIFDAQDFEKTFANNKEFVKQFTDFEEKRLSGTKTEFFYKEIAEPFIAVNKDIPFTHFDIRDYKEALENDDKKDDVKLIALFKLLSPEHLLKLPFLNDSNSLDKSFYSELLHIIGLEETKDGSKKIIQRKKSGEQNSASLIENTIIQLDSLDKIHRIENSSQYGTTYEEKLFSVAIELVITWVNRILFLKLLEAQQIKYHKGDENFAYLNSKKIKGFDDLNTLFFQVLSRKTNERSEEIKKLFALVPYLNSSLFEISTLEDRCFTISQLKDNELQLFAATVLKENTGKKKSGKMGVLEYFFEFLEAYDFSSEGSEEIQEENKTLINASVLGLIFEKINGYKDGSFFTPGFITTNMCRETIRRAVVQKFNEVKGWNCKNFEPELYNKIDSIDIKEANQIINSLKVCDPAVGSGHFLVSALNEIIAIKSALGILTDRTGRKIKDYSIEVENDELIITDGEDGTLFEYNPKNKESQRIQEALFHEKQTIIENCLFGVDINQNSVNICRLRLWIELLKNAYYITSSDTGQSVGAGQSRVRTGRDLSLQDTELQTLPNIDINIKKGNSLISKHALDSDIKAILKKRKWKIEDYKNAVRSYQNAKDKSQKREMDVLIHSMKTEFIVELNDNHPDEVALRKVNQKLATQSMFELTKKEIDELEKAKKEKARLETKLQEMKDNKIYQNSFEWRFEFPEVLNEDGDFVGFDVVIGNPPYGVRFSDTEKSFYKETFNEIHVRTPESYNYFWGLTFRISKNGGLCNFITPSSFLSQIEFEKTRKFILENYSLYLVINLGDAIFEDVATPTCIVGFSKNKGDNKSKYIDISAEKRDLVPDLLFDIKTTVDTSSFISNDSYSLVFKPYKSILEKCYKHPSLKEIAEEVATGVSSGLDKAYVYTNEDIQKYALESKLLKKLIIGGEINRYSLTPTSNKKIIYVISEDDISKFPNIEKQLLPYKDQLNKRRECASGQITWYSLNWPRRKKLFENPKILIRQTANKILASYDEDKWYCLKSGLIVQLPDESEIKYFYLLALLNSKLMDFLYHDLVDEDNRIFPEVKPIQLFKLPICKASSKEQTKIESLVTKIIEAKKKDPAADTGKWEKEIDEMVFHLYQLTYDEVLIVDPNFNKSRKEYEESGK